MGLLMGTHWEFEWNMLRTNGKIESNFSLLGNFQNAMHFPLLHYTSKTGKKAMNVVKKKTITSFQ
jgi:hypothetical protein